MRFRNSTRILRTYSQACLPTQRCEAWRGGAGLGWVTSVEGISISVRRERRRPCQQLVGLQEEQKPTCRPTLKHEHQHRQPNNTLTSWQANRRRVNVTASIRRGERKTSSGRRAKTNFQTLFAKTKQSPNPNYIIISA